MADETKFVEVTWKRVVKVWWSLVWRYLLYSTLVGVGIGFILGLVLAIVGAFPEVIAKICGITGLVFAIPVSIVVTRIVLKKRYSDFKIALIEERNDARV